MAGLDAEASSSSPKRPRAPARKAASSSALVRDTTTSLVSVLKWLFQWSTRTSRSWWSLATARMSVA